MYYGRPRFTEDVDFVAVSGHMEVLGNNLEVGSDSASMRTTRSNYHHTGLQIDVWKDQFSDGIVQRAIEATLAVRAVRVADPHDLIALKPRAHRLVDDYDILLVAGANVIDLQRFEALVTAEEMGAFHEIMKRV